MEAELTIMFQFYEKFYAYRLTSQKKTVSKKSFAIIVFQYILTVRVLD